MDYKEATEYLFRQLPMFSRVGAAAYKPGLETTHRLDEFFGHPHRRFKSIHVGGTNGKGSTSHMLASVLQAQGYKVGLYTSPHLVDFRERIRINGEMISESHVVDFVERYLASGYEGHPSFFELTMMLAFDCFASEKVDYAVIEVGMGGRLDSTNVITPEACIITNISKDHTQFLGATLPEIAAEKAGIIKGGIPVVIGEAENPDVRRVFEEKAEAAGAPIIFAEDAPAFAEAHRNDDGDWVADTELFDKIELPLQGDYQLKNLNTVLTAIPVLRGRGIKISDVSVRNGIRDVTTATGLAGRWMTLGRKPLIIADTGHNVAGLSYNMEQLHKLMAERPAGAKLRMVIGFVADKDIDNILSLLPKDAEYYFTQASIPRALPVADLVAKCEAAGLVGCQYPDVESAYAAATAQALEEDVIYVGGSTFVVADLLAHLGS